MGVGVLRVGCGVGGCVVENVCGWWSVPCFALKYVELVWSFHWGIAGFPL